MKTPIWTRKPSKLAVATNEGWEQTWAGKTKIIKQHKGLLDALTAAGYDKYGVPIQLGTVDGTPKSIPVEPQEAILNELHDMLVAVENGEFEDFKFNDKPDVKLDTDTKRGRGRPKGAKSARKMDKNNEAIS